jgi:predicted metal-dependent phosphoesterase TrpH
MIIDLHTHSYYSADGKLSIPELLSFYSKGDIVALTDHETIAGWPEFKEEALKKGIRPIFGVEWFIKNCCHILSYFVSEIPQNFREFMIERRSKERNSMHLLYDRAKLLCPSLSLYEDILTSKMHPENILGMAALAEHIAHESGIEFRKVVTMMREEKGKLSEDDKPTTFYANELINKIREWNGISVLAHPFKHPVERSGRQNVEDVEVKVRELAGMGIKGIELFSDGSCLAELERLLGLAHDLRLIVSIGSDYHSKEKGLNPLDLEKLDESVKNEVIKWLSCR